MSNTGKDPIEFAMKRLAAVFNPPEVNDLQQFTSEFRTALQQFSSEAMIEGVSEVIRSRKAKSFPSIGEVRQAVMDAIPAVSYSQAPPRSYAVTDESKRKEAVAMLASHPQVDRLIEMGMHNRVLEFVLESGRFPAADEWFAVKQDHLKVQRHIEKSMGPNTHYFITRMAEAILHRRAKLAEEIYAIRKEQAA